MKHILKTFMITALVLMLLLSSLAVFPMAAEEYTEDFLGNNDVPAATHLDPVNPNASREAKNLLAYLQTLTDSDRFIVGTFDISDTNRVYNNVIEQLDAECALYSQRYTIVVEEDFEYEGVYYPPMSFYNHKAVNENLAAHYHNGNVLLIHGDTVIEDFLLDYVLRTGMAKDEAEADGMGLITHLDATNPDRDPYMYSVLVEHNNNMIDALRELESMGVKAYMYRPWVEFTRFEFHGVTPDQRDISRRVWQQTSDLFKNSGLEGVLLTWAPQNRWYEHYYWYPGNEYVDVIAPTMYGVPSSEPGMGGYLAATKNVNYDWFVKTGKPYGFSEISCRKAAWETAYADGRQSWYQTLKSIINVFPATTWVNCWADGSYSLSNHTDNQPNKGNDDGYLFLNSMFSINLDNMLDYRVTQLDSPGVVQLYTEKNFAGNDKDTLNNKWIGLEERTYTYTDLKALGLDPKDIASFHLNSGLGIMLYTSDDATGKSWGYLLSQSDLSGEACYGKIRSLQVIRPKLLSQDKEGIYAHENDDEAWKANDGMGSRWKADVDEKGRGWLVLDLEEPCVISSWEVLHAGAAEEVDIYNTVDYCLQVSLDGKTWTTVDSVEDNTANRTDRNLTKNIEGQYFRLLITDPNRVTAGVDVNVVTIVDWKLYGLETGKDPQSANWDALLNPDYVDAPDEDTKPEDDSSNGEDTTPEEDTSAGDSTDNSQDADDGETDKEDTSEEEDDRFEAEDDTEAEDEDTKTEDDVTNNNGDDISDDNAEAEDDVTDENNGDDVSDDNAEVEDTIVDDGNNDDDWYTDDEFDDDEYVDDEEEDPSEEEPTESDEEDEPSKKKKVYLTTIVDWTWIIVAIVAAVVVIGGGILWFVLAKRRRTAKAVSEEEIA